MKIAIQKDHNHEDLYFENWATYFKKHGVSVKFVNLLDLNLSEQLKGCDGLMWRTLHTANDKQVAEKVLYLIENFMNIPVFPNQDTYWHYDEKITQAYLFKVLDIPTPDTWVFWKKSEAFKWAKNAQYPTIFKFSTGAGSSNVKLIKDVTQAEEIIHLMFSGGLYSSELENGNLNRFTKGNSIKDLFKRLKAATKLIFLDKLPRINRGWNWEKENNYVYFQEFLKGNDFDTRITVIGDRAFGFRRFNRKGDFRASGSGNIDYNPKEIDLEFIKIAFESSKKLRSQSMAYDFIYRDEKPVIVEISYTFAAWAVFNCPGFWNSNLEWVDGQIRPEDAIAEDFLKYINQKRK